MSRRLICELFVLAAFSLALPMLARAGDADAKYVWKPPINVTQALKIKKETKATPELLKAASSQCVDDDCKKAVAECGKHPNCVLVPSAASVHESEVENN